MLPPRLLGSLSDERVVTVAQELVRLPSENPPGNEIQMASYVQGFLESLGCKTTRLEPSEGRVSVVGSVRGSQPGPRIIINGHLDTKPAKPPGVDSDWTCDPFSGLTVDGRLYGLGACDMKGGMAAALCALEILSAHVSELHGEVLFHAVADEEAGSRWGTAWLGEQGLIAADMAIVPEPTGLQICPAQLGTVWATIDVCGRRGHACLPSLGSNAIEKALAIAQAVSAWTQEAKARNSHPLFPDHPCFSIGSISGGYHPGVIAEHCRMVIDRRLLPTESRADTLSRLASIAKRVGDSGSPCKVTISEFLSGGAEPFEVSVHEPVVQLLADAYRSVTGQDAVVGGFPAFSDAGILVNRYGIPSVICGPGHIEQAHAVDEFVSIGEVLLFSRILLVALWSLLSNPR